MYYLEIRSYYEYSVIAKVFLSRALFKGNNAYYLEYFGNNSMVQAVTANLITDNYYFSICNEEKALYTHLHLRKDNNQRFIIKEVKHTIQDIIQKRFIQKSITISPLNIINIGNVEGDELNDAIIKVYENNSEIPLPEMVQEHKKQFIQYLSVEFLDSIGFGDDKFIIPVRYDKELLAEYFGFKQAEKPIPIKNFMLKHGKNLKLRALNALKPIFVANKLDKQDSNNKDRLDDLIRKPLPAQKIPILSVAKGLAHKKGIFLVGEMGTGKTFMSLATAKLINAKRTIVLCPTHLLSKWEREIKLTIKNAKVLNLNQMGIQEILALRGTKPSLDEPEFWLIGKEQAKLHYATKTLPIKEGGIVQCPQCGEKIELKHSKTGYVYGDTCPNCGEKLIYADNTRVRRYAKSLLLKKYFHFDLLIADEVHELKGDNTAQGQALANLASVSNKVLALTGTLMGGYANNMFYLLWRVAPQIMIKLGLKYDRSREFVEKYGVFELVSKNYTDHKMSIGKRISTTFKEKPGISPALITHILENAVFVKLSDISSALPPFEEEVVSVQMSENQAKTYREFEKKLMSQIGAALARGDKSLLGKMVQSLYGLPDGARRGEIVERNGQIIASAVPVNEYLLPKEEYLVDIIRQERAKGRKVLVYLEHTGTRDLMPDLKERIESLVGDTVKVDCLYSDAVKVENREQWINEHNNDVLIVNPRLVQTGLDLYQYPTIVYFQTGYSIFTLRQASRRSWRIGQTNPVKVYYLAYDGTLQTKALKLMASKMEASLAVEGDLTDKGLTALSESENSILVELARSIEEKVTPEDVKEIWKQVKKGELFGDAVLQSEHRVEEVATTAVTSEVVTKVDGKEVKTRFTVVSQVKVADKAATFMVNNNIYQLHNGRVISNKKVVGKYVWKESKTGAKFAVCYLNDIKKTIYVGKHKDTGKFVALELTA